jgi:hypothetical protein
MIAAMAVARGIMASSADATAPFSGTLARVVIAT